MNDSELEKLTSPSWMKSLGVISKHAECVKTSHIPAMVEVMNRHSALISPVASELSRIGEVSKLISNLAIPESIIYKNSLFEQLSKVTLELNKHLSNQVLSEIRNNTSFISQALQKSLGQTHKLFAAEYIADYSKHISQASALANTIKVPELPSLKIFHELKNSPFFIPDVSGLRKISEVDLSNFIDDEGSPDFSYEVAIEIGETNDFNSLSESAKQFLYYFYHTYLLPILLGCLSSIIMTQLQLAQDELAKCSTPREIKKVIRSSSSFDKDALSGYRVTISDSLNLRTEPALKSEIIESLPIGTLLEVIDKSKKSWILVEIEINDETIQGWVSRKHTIYIK